MSLRNHLLFLGNNYLDKKQLVSISSKKDKTLDWWYLSTSRVEKLDKNLS